jgi:histidinol-phosphatase
MSMRDYTEDLKLAQLMADISDEITRARFQAQDLRIETKPDNTPVTDADKAVEQKIRALIAEHRPHDLFVGEEFGRDDLDGNSHYWVVDPIDGTKNFLRGVPTWATLIALIDPENNTAVGLVSAPALYRRWFASRGNGAFRSVNNSPAQQMHVSGIKNVSDASISYSDLNDWGDRYNAFLALQQKVNRVRGLGDFWSHMLVAEGAVEIAIEPSLAVWDMAALDIVVREAGGRFTNLQGIDGPHGGSGVSTNGLLHNEVIAFLSSQKNSGN